MLNAVDNLNEKTVHQGNLEQLIKNWPGDEFEGLIQEADENKNDKWEKTETYFIKLGSKKKFELRIKLWLFKMTFATQIQNLMEQ